MQSSNPVLNRLGDAAARERGGGSQGQWAPPGQNPFQNQYGQQYDQVPQYQQQAPGRVMTLDDVVVRTIMLLALTGIAGALSWILIPRGSGVEFLAMIGSVLAGLVLGLVITFARVTNPVVIAAYAVIEGVLLGVVSRFYEARFGGIVMQAVAGTFVIFFVMAGLYKVGAIRATPRFRKFVIGALIAFVVLSLINFVAYLAGWDIGLTDGVDGPVSGLAIVFAAAGILIGALTFILDFDQVEQSVRAGLPEKYSWYCAFGLLVGLIFLYWQVLRMLSYLRR
ncbi:membrane protein [Virgisporangium aliadipatigenens]|uniref:Membrane protein n=1 Tax=Virgisporangium aliadipatigenens TaxID=741659 RepID=A0A8J4DPN0_9ACTN|nr:Bax inhibitor-1/YccA family protein [Virgisporangium aliadipatigenens]GIJ44833.1 membrane protein [Virgisporangium aliadipatigenens]